MYEGSQDVVLPDCASVAGLSLMRVRTAPGFIIFCRPKIEHGREGECGGGLKAMVILWMRVDYLLPYSGQM